MGSVGWFTLESKRRKGKLRLFGSNSAIPSLLTTNIIDCIVIKFHNIFVNVKWVL